MQDLIVLGLIPGTQIQITFYGWLLLSGGVLLAGVLLHALLRAPWLHKYSTTLHRRYINYQFQIPA